MDMDKQTGGVSPAEMKPAVDRAPSQPCPISFSHPGGSGEGGQEHPTLALAGCCPVPQPRPAPSLPSPCSPFSPSISRKRGPGPNPGPPTDRALPAPAREPKPMPHASFNAE